MTTQLFEEYPHMFVCQNCNGAMEEDAIDSLIAVGMLHVCPRCGDDIEYVTGYDIEHNKAGGRNRKI